MAEVVGFTRDEVFLSPFGDMSGIGPSSEVIPLKMTMQIKVGQGFSAGSRMAMAKRSMSKNKGPLILTESYPVIESPPDPLKRQLIEEPLAVGVRASTAF